MRLIYEISKSPTGYADHQHKTEKFFECESMEEYEEMMSNNKLTEEPIHAREYYDAHCWQGQHWDAVGGSKVTCHDWLQYTRIYYVKPGSIVNKEEVKFIDNWWEGS